MVLTCIAWAAILTFSSKGIPTTSDLESGIASTTLHTFNGLEGAEAKKKSKMTDEEKKEFEEFLKWKKEKLQHEAKEEGEEKQKEDISSQSPLNSPKDKEIKEENNNPLKWVVLFLGIIFFLFIGVKFIRSYNSAQLRKQEVQNQALIGKVQQVATNAKQDSIEKAERAAKAKQDSIDRINREKMLKHSIRIKSAYLSSPNSASGADAIFYYKNTSSKTIKYLRWHGYPINAVGDIVTCDIRNYSEFTGQDTGPIKPGRSGGGCWSCAWYNWTAKKLVLTGVDIEYMDGTQLSITKDELKYIR